MSASASIILVIEDDPSLQKFLRVTLETQKHNVIVATRGEEGMRHAALSQPDLIILDLGLPDMDGVQVTQRDLRDGDELTFGNTRITFQAS